MSAEEHLDQDLKGELLVGQRVKGRAFWAEATHTRSLSHTSGAGAWRQMGGKPRLKRKLEARSSDHAGAREEAARGSHAWDQSAVEGKEGGGGCQCKGRAPFSDHGDLTTSQPGP